jgi:hypothetical protein
MWKQISADIEAVRTRSLLAANARLLYIIVSLLLGVGPGKISANSASQSEKAAQTTLRIELREVDSLGNVSPIQSWSIELIPDWSEESSSSDSLSRPLFTPRPRVRITPRNVAVTSLEIKNSEVIRREKGFEFFLKSSALEGSYVIEGRRLNFVGRILGPALITHESCEDIGLRTSQQGESFQGSFIAMSCTRNDSGIEIHLYHGEDINLNSAQRHIRKGNSWERSQPRQASKGRQVHSISFPEDGAQSSLETSIFQFEVESQAEVGSSLAYLVKAQKKRNSRWSGSIGLSSTFIQYQESLAALNMWGNYLTAKGSGAFEVIPGALSIGANAFGTVLPLYFSDQARPHPWFLGVNGRVGYTLPWKVWQGAFGVNLGYYFWSMIVRNQAYGLRLVSGPQLFLTYGRRGLGVRQSYFYFKFAPLFSGDPGYQFGNRDVALGSAIQINSAHSQYPIQLTVDVAHLAISSIAAGNTIQTLTGSLGLNFSF